MKGAPMNNTKFRTYYFLCLSIILLASFYPLYMGIKVLVDYVQFGFVMGENYPKYLIPYTPISLALITGVALLPLSMKLKKWGQAALTGLCIGLFLGFELLLENLVIRNAYLSSSLGSWQMYLCAVPSIYFEGTAIEILIGDYSPTFKLHFYAIAMLIILTVINSFYGFGKQIQTDDRSRHQVLKLQSVGSGLFLGLCILACFTAFFRDGRLEVSPISAILMAVFFIVFGLIAGIFAMSFLTKKPRSWAWLPGVVASAMALLMYIGEMCLLSGHVYLFGTGWFFSPLGVLVLAPVDILIILASGALTAAVSLRVLKKSDTPPEEATQDIP